MLVGVILPDSTADPRDPLGELGSLAKTAGAKVVGRIIQRRHKVDAGSYIGSGKAEEIAALAVAEDAEVVIFDNDLTPSQIGQLEKIINQHAGRRYGEGINVIDRSELILDIFATRARTYEAKLQVELAQMEYTYPRLAKMWGHLERIASGAGGGMGIGTRGPGETQLETDRRLVRKRVSVLKADIAKVQDRKTRLVADRTARHFTVCVVGYTNAGKSTLFNALTTAGTYADDKLFATLDTKTRAWKLERGTDVLLSDTVGFVRDLPHNLVASFRATLEEAVHADLLLHVLDVGHPARPAAVRQRASGAGRDRRPRQAGDIAVEQDRHARGGRGGPVLAGVGGRVDSDQCQDRPRFGPAGRGGVPARSGAAGAGRTDGRRDRRAGAGVHRVAHAGGGPAVRRWSGERRGRHGQADVGRLVPRGPGGGRPGRAGGGRVTVWRLLAGRCHYQENCPMLKQITTVAAAALLAVAVVGCQDQAERTTGPGVENYDYSGSHFNPAVNSSGSMVGRDNPAVNPDKTSATGTGTPNTGQMLNGSGGSSTVGNSGTTGANMGTTGGN